MLELRFPFRPREHLAEAELQLAANSVAGEPGTAAGRDHLRRCKRCRDRLRRHRLIAQALEGGWRLLPDPLPVRRYERPTQLIRGVIAAAVCIVFIVGSAVLYLRGPQAGSDIRLPMHVATSDEPLARVGGRLLLHDGCIYLVSGSVEHLIIWPQGYTVRGDAIHDGTGRAVARIGSSVAIAGGEIPVSQRAWLLDHLMSPPELPSCPAKAYWFATDVADE